MKHKRILAMILAVASCLSLAVSASAANTPNRKATDFRDFDRTAWYAEAVSAAVDNGLLYGKSSSIIDPNGAMTRAEMAAIINRSFGCYAKADISKYKDVSKDKWYFEDVAMAVQMGTYNGRSNTAMAPDAPITRQEALTVVARALELDYDSYSKTDLSAFSDRSEISNWAMPYVRAMVGADYIHGRGKILAPLDNITRAEFAQIFYNIIGTYIVSKGTYDKDIKGSVLVRTDDVTFKDMTVDGDLIIGCGAADGKIVLDNVTVKGRLLVWGGGVAAIYWCSGSGSYHALIPAAAEAWGLPVSGCTASEPQRITDALSSGKLVVAIMSAGHFTSSGHFIVLRGVQDEKILVADPASRTRSEQSWELSIILNEASKAAGSGGPFWIIG